MDNIQKKYSAALLQIEELKQEIDRLRTLLKHPVSENIAITSDQIPLNSASQTTANKETTSGETNIHQYSTVEDKLSLYKNHFRGRDDVYPVRWNNKQGKAGYSPACGNEWKPICDKPKVKCSVCKYQNFLPLTNEVLSGHLDARQDRTIGIYPMLSDETCWFLAMDFDKHEWQQDVTAILQLCKSHGIPAALERSRSGNGGHIWIFFSENIEAAMARKLGMTLLNLTMKKRYQIGLESYDRLFPNQDTLPKGGFGNLIALPLQGGPLKNGNSTFIDGTFEPYADQWNFLSGIGKMTKDEVNQFVYKNEERELLYKNTLISVASDFEDGSAWIQEKSIQKEEELLEPLPNEIWILYSDRIYIPKQGLPSSAIYALIKLASFSNPDFYKTQAMRLSTYGKPKVISCAEDLESFLALPRGCLKEVLSFFERYKVSVHLNDQRTEGTSIEAGFIGTLTTLQDTAARAILTSDIGILSAATAFGKTVVAASIIASRKTNTLILVHRRELMEQWQERLQTFLNVPKNTIGVIGGGKDKRTGMIDIAVIQSLKLPRQRQVLRQ